MRQEQYQAALQGPFLLPGGQVGVPDDLGAIEEIPEFRTMIFVSIVALAANIICLYLMQKNIPKLKLLTYDNYLWKIRTKKRVVLFWAPDRQD